METFENLPVLTQVSVLLLVAGTVYAHYRFTAKSAIDGPAILTTAGIFFTFFGIVVGLLNFDAQNIEASVPALLNGLKTAFVASAFGVFAALSIKLRYAIWGIPTQYRRSDQGGATIDDLVGQLAAVQHALVGTDESTLLSQMKLARSDTNDRLDALRKSQHEFMERMAENNSKALIQALQEVIRDFNSKINEQFGDNFKQLNAAVEKILVWQENYRQQISEMITQQRTAAENMTVSTERYSALVGKAEIFTSISERLSELLNAMQTQSDRVEDSLKSLAQLLSTAATGLPQLEKKIFELTEQMTFGVKLHQEETTKALKDASNETNKALRDASIALQSAVSDSKKTMVDAIQASNQEFRSHIIDISTKTKEQVAALDVALERELTKAIETLARQLTALSQKFVEDYSPLTDRLRQVVSMSRGI